MPKKSDGLSNQRKDDDGRASWSLYKEDSSSGTLDWPEHVDFPSYFLLHQIPSDTIPQIWDQCVDTFVKFGISELKSVAELSKRLADQLSEHPYAEYKVLNRGPYEEPDIVDDSLKTFVASVSFRYSSDTQSYDQVSIGSISGSPEEDTEAKARIDDRIRDLKRTQALARLRSEISYMIINRLIVGKNIMYSNSMTTHQWREMFHLQKHGSISRNVAVLVEQYNRWRQRTDEDGNPEPRSLVTTKDFANLVEEACDDMRVNPRASGLNSGYPQIPTEEDEIPEPRDFIRVLQREIQNAPPSLKAMVGFKKENPFTWLKLLHKMYCAPFVPPR